MLARQLYESRLASNKGQDRDISGGRLYKAEKKTEARMAGRTAEDWQKVGGHVRQDQYKPA